MGVLLNNQWYELSNTDGRQPLLSWLREENQLHGTKEGCGAGDCGACTVLVGRYDGHKMYYQSVNACIALLGSFSGCHLVTLEGLSLSQGNTSHHTEAPLHPVQQAMVDFHGSQCGFCTPGIVMAMLAWWLNTPASDLQSEQQHTLHRQHFMEALSGNLCRCTGYHPILKAADFLAPSCLGGHLETTLLCGLSEQDIIQQLQAASPSNSQHPTASNLYWQPTSQAQLDLAIAANTTRFVAGSTDLGLEITQQLRVPEGVVDVTKLPGFKDLYEQDDCLYIGGAVTFTELENFILQQHSSANTHSHTHAHTHAHIPANASMHQAWLTLLPLIGSRQVRNVGTLGGNIANSSPIADTPPLLLVLDAMLVLQHKNTRRELPLADFYLGYKQNALQAGELIKAIKVPLPKPATRVYVEKVSKRKEDDISAVCLALVMGRTHQQASQQAITCKIGLGGVAATPVYAHTLANFIVEQIGKGVEQSLTLATLQELLAVDITPMSDVRASADYRLQVCATTLHYWFMKEGLSPTKLVQEIKA